MGHRMGPGVMGHTRPVFVLPVIIPGGRRQVPVFVPTERCQSRLRIRADPADLTGG